MDGVQIAPPFADFGSSWTVISNTHNISVKVAAGEEYPGGVVKEYFNGQIDEVAIWDKALTEDEILAIYNSQK